MLFFFSPLCCPLLVFFLFFFFFSFFSLILWVGSAVGLRGVSVGCNTRLCTISLWQVMSYHYLCSLCYYLFHWISRLSCFTSFSCLPLFSYLKDGNEVFFRIKRSTALRKLMSAYCDRQSVDMNSIAFLFDGRRLRGE